MAKPEPPSTRLVTVRTRVIGPKGTAQRRPPVVDESASYAPPHSAQEVARRRAEAAAASLPPPHSALEVARRKAEEDAASLPPEAATSQPTQLAFDSGFDPGAFGGGPIGAAPIGSGPIGGGPIGGVPFGAAPFGSMPFGGGGGLNTAPLNTQMLNETPPPLPPSHAPERVPESIAPLDTSLVDVAVVTGEPKEGLSSGGGATGSPRGGGRDHRVIHLADSFNRPVIAFHVQALITAFEEVDAYDPARNHNSEPPALWNDDPDYRKDVKALLGELRRLNDTLESSKELNPLVIGKIGKTLAQGAATIYKSACVTVGAGLGIVILGTFVSILSELGLKAELTEILSWGFKPK